MSRTKQDIIANGRRTGPVSAILWTVVMGGVNFAADPAGTQPAETRIPVAKEVVQHMPPARSRQEVEAILKGSDPNANTRPIHIVLVAGPKDHGPGEHDYPAWQTAWQRLLAKAPKTRVTTAWEVPSADDLQSADVLVLFKHRAWPKELNTAIDAFFARGGGMVLVHFAVDGNQNPESVEKHIGLYWGAGPRFRHGPVDLVMQQKNAPLLRGLAGKTIHFHDETYWRLTGEPSRVDLLATGFEDEQRGHVEIPLIWNRTSGKGRVHVNILGHYNWTFNDPLFRILLLRGIAWAAQEPIDRFHDLVLIDATAKD